MEAEDEKRNGLVAKATLAVLLASAIGTGVVWLAEHERRLQASVSSNTSRVEEMERRIGSLEAEARRIAGLAAERGEYIRNNERRLLQLEERSARMR
jgi:hypothetical protein